MNFVVYTLFVCMRKGEQLPWIVSDELWARIEPLLPRVERRYRHPGRKRLASPGRYHGARCRTNPVTFKPASTVEIIPRTKLP
jgi:transposase